MTNNKPIVDILLSVYNGLSFLEQQLESIAAQTYTHWRVFARDDGSTDGSAAILMEWQKRYPNRFYVYQGENVGVKESFHRLAIESSAPYVMFCDQDDFWDSDKIDVLLRVIQKAECRRSKEIPLLVFSDLRIIDREGKETGKSFWAAHGIHPDHTTLNRLMLQNVVTGCACLMNRALLQASLPFPSQAVLHDWWVALHACLFGEVIAVERSTVSYRLHGANQVGARRAGLSRIYDFILSPGNLRRRLKEHLQKTSLQAEALRRAVDGRVSEEKVILLLRFSQIQHLSHLHRVIFLLKYHIFFSNYLRNVCLMLL